MCSDIDKSHYMWYRYKIVKENKDNYAHTQVQPREHVYFMCINPSDSNSMKKEQI